MEKTVVKPYELNSKQQAFLTRLKCTANGRFWVL